MSEPWTPGPWIVLNETTVWGGGDPDAIPQTGHYVVPPDDMSPEKQRPEDARLIALAPEMAELLEYLLHPASGCSPKVLGWAGDLLARVRGDTA